MKKILTSVALMCACLLTASAQRSVNWQIRVVSPAEGATVKLNSTLSADSTLISYQFINNGPDSVISTDTILFSDGFTGGEFISLFLSNDTTVVRMGDTVGFSRGRIQITSTDIEDGPGEWCAAAFVIDINSNLINDVDTNNNVSCNNITWKNVTGTSIKNLVSGKSNLSLATYPNPAINNVSFKFNMVGGDATVRLTDIAGRSILVKEFGKQVAGEKELTLDLSAVNNGMYYVELVNGENRAISKITVQK